ncbi:MAG: hypothetical protein IJJ33_11210 [Victivallales bacterium]|nr:hypothetical protein [Victivallales bacterium]
MLGKKLNYENSWTLNIARNSNGKLPSAIVAEQSVWWNCEALFAQINFLDKPPMNAKLSSLPVSDCPLIPMGAITGTPDRASLASTLEKWRAVGVTQFMIYARSGCEEEYLSPQYMELCRWICSEAQRLHFSAIWLYDEFNWPSGT